MSNGADADLTGASIEFTSSRVAIARVDAAGLIEALQAGVAKVTAAVTLDGVTRAAHLWIDVADPRLLLADIWLTHPTMAMEIGRPAVIPPSGEFPVAARGVARRFDVDREARAESRAAAYFRCIPCT